MSIHPELFFSSLFLCKFVCLCSKLLLLLSLSSTILRVAAMLFSLLCLTLVCVDVWQITQVCCAWRWRCFSHLSRHTRTGWWDWRRWRCHGNCRSSRALVWHRPVIGRWRSLSCRRQWLWPMSGALLRTGWVWHGLPDARLVTVAPRRLATAAAARNISCRTHHPTYTSMTLLWTYSLRISNSSRQSTSMVNAATWAGLSAPWRTVKTIYYEIWQSLKEIP